MPKKRISARVRHERAKKQGLALLGGYEAQIASQRGCCVCGIVPKVGQRRLSIDHAHLTGEVRGLLCHRHNRMIGWAGDNPNYLETAAVYLKWGWVAACAYRDALRTMKG